MSRVEFTYDSVVGKPYMVVGDDLGQIGSLPFIRVSTEKGIETFYRGRISEYRVIEV